MSKHPVIRRALITDALAIDNLLSEWLDWKPETGRRESVLRAIVKRELIVAEASAELVGFIHYVMHEDIIDGDPNSFITAFYVSPKYRRKGVGSLLLERAMEDSLRKGAVGVETSTIHALARKLYEKHHFKQTVGDIGEVFLELDIPDYVRARKHLTESRR